MTLVEILIASGLAGIIGVVIVAGALHVTRGTAAISNYTQMNTDSRTALDTMSRKIRGAEVVEAYAPNRMAFRTQTGASLVYAWNPRSGELVEVEEGRRTVLVTGCENFRFDVYQRSPMQNEFSLFDTTTSIAETKMVQVTWQSSRSAGPSADATKETTSAKIMMRLP